MKTLTLDYSAIQGKAASLLRAYDIPLNGLAEYLLVHPDAILGHREVRIEHLESILAQHVPQGHDYYELTDDAGVLDDALIPWRQMVERILGHEGVAPENVTFSVVRYIGDAVVMAVHVSEEY